MKEFKPQLVCCQRGPMVQGTSFESEGLLNGSIPGEDIYFHFDFFFGLLPVPHSSAGPMQIKSYMTIHIYMQCTLL